MRRTRAVVAGDREPRATPASRRGSRCAGMRATRCRVSHSSARVPRNGNYGSRPPVTSALSTGLPVNQWPWQRGTGSLSTALARPVVQGLV